jgi:hypothetical protein
MTRLVREEYIWLVSDSVEFKEAQSGVKSGKGIRRRAKQCSNTAVASTYCWPPVDYFEEQQT